MGKKSITLIFVPYFKQVLEIFSEHFFIMKFCWKLQFLCCLQYEMQLLIVSLPFRLYWYFKKKQINLECLNCMHCHVILLNSSKSDYKSKTAWNSAMVFSSPEHEDHHNNLWFYGICRCTVLPASLSIDKI